MKKIEFKLIEQAKPALEDGTPVKPSFQLLVDQVKEYSPEWAAGITGIYYNGGLWEGDRLDWLFSYTRHSYLRLVMRVLPHLTKNLSTRVLGSCCLIGHNSLRCRNNCNT